MEAVTMMKIHKTKTKMIKKEAKTSTKMMTTMMVTVMVKTSKRVMLKLQMSSWVNSATTIIGIWANSLTIVMSILSLLNLMTE